MVSDRHVDERSPARHQRSPPPPPSRRLENEDGEERQRDRGSGVRDGDRRDNQQPRRKGVDSYRPGGGPPRHREAPPPPRRERTPPPVVTEEQKQAAAKAEYDRLINARSGGTYIPPARLRALQAQIGTDKTTKEWQRMAWEALKKSINGLINKANSPNLKLIVPELFQENLVRGKGLFCQSIMKAQAASLPFTPIYAAMVAVVNTKLPVVGELLVKRLVLRFRKAFRRNDKAVCLSTTTFIAHLTNHQVVSEMLVAQMLMLLLHKPTDDSVEIAVNLTREVGHFLEEMNEPIARVVFDQFRNILHDSDIEKRVQYQIEVLFQQRKDKFKDNPSIKEELDLVEEEDQITHNVDLNGDLDGQDGLNIFKLDPEYEEHEEAYKILKAEILGEDDDDEDDSDDEDESSESEDEEVKAVEIKDQSNADLVNLRRTIYLTLMSSADYEESVHKLLRIQIPVGFEKELPEMVVECCSQEKTYTKFYGGIAERLAKINRLWNDLFDRAFMDYYEKIHRYDSNKLRNIARLFGHMFGSDAIAWHCLSVIHLNEEETTSASRIFIKILFQEIVEEIGMAKVQARCRDEILLPSLQGLFPRGDNRRNIRFAINYFTSIGMGALTEDMREYLQSLPPPALPAPVKADESDSDSASSYSSYTGSSYSRSRSPPPRRNIDRRRSVSRTPSPPRRDRRNRSYDSRDRSSSRSRSPPPRRDARDVGGRGRSLTRSPPARRVAAKARSYSRSTRSYSSERSLSRSRSPPPRKAPARRSPSDSRSPPPRRSASRSLSRSRSPPPRRVTNRSLSKSRTPPPRRAAARSISRSPSPPLRHRPAPRSISRSRSPDPARRGADSYRGGRSLSRSRSPPPRRGVLARRTRSPSRDSRSASPLPRRARRSSSSPVGDEPRGERRRRNSSSDGSSVPRKRYRRDD